LKISITVDCTPEEARSFFGMPDLKPLQESLLAQMQAQMKNAAVDPETIFKTVFPMQSEAFAGLQKAFWSQFGAAKPSDER
jgi:hypothetical protein